MDGCINSLEINRSIGTYTDNQDFRERYRMNDR